MSPRRRNAVAVAFGLFAAAGVLIIAEGLGWWQLGSRGIARDTFLIDLPNRSEAGIPAFQQSWGKDLVVSYIDSILGYAHDPRMHPLLQHGPPGFVMYGAEPQKVPGAIRIVALGGSTTDPLTALSLNDVRVDPNNPYNWPRALAQILHERGVEATVYNGGVAGYSAAQEYLKLVRDGLTLEPDIVLALNGVNEVSDHRMPGHPLIHRYQQKLFESLTRDQHPVFLPNFRRWIQVRRNATRNITGVTFGVESNSDRVKQWRDSIRLAHAAADEFNVHYLTMLQPLLGFGEYQPSASEQALMKGKDEYFAIVRKFYEPARGQCAQLPYCADLTDIFHDTPDAYLDLRHQNEKGAHRIAQAIADILQSRGWLHATVEREAAPGDGQ